MPLFEYTCGACGAAHELLVRRATDPAPPCPSCGRPALRKELSTFSPAVAGGPRRATAAAGHTHGPSCGCGRPAGSCGLGG